MPMRYFWSASSRSLLIFRGLSLSFPLRTLRLFLIWTTLVRIMASPRINILPSTMSWHNCNVWNEEENELLNLLCWCLEMQRDISTIYNSIANISANVSAINFDVVTQYPYMNFSDLRAAVDARIGMSNYFLTTLIHSQMRFVPARSALAVALCSMAEWDSLSWVVSEQLSSWDISFTRNACLWFLDCD